MRGFGVLVVGLCGCGGKGDVTCTPLVDGDWTFDGTAMGMPMGATVTMDAEGCTFTFADWSMEMMSLPLGGSIDGTDVTLDGDALWSSCTGTVNAEGTEASGTCEDGASDFTMAAGALQTDTM